MYKFFIKSDKTKDAVGKTNQNSIEEAYTYFSIVKKMSLDAFKKIFSVEEIK